ncbi:16S rRNA (guanine(527)-N(7))-methyltransferase RsmG [Paenibacillus sp. N1-5-1-14]|uniref:16S rRNA (guanine(527)-N(7))-methyltransferase RsmG n=1 Tax=Paenibacillus radicibacter TaxID=2972488 RepID=UPI002158FB0C|nr:16S rRNA (guanine(527)-N(7))-methyltransferase RsmG [Paenibacillus radicibacter]MCR8643002.1 16S rRNA (guanine(527)-N(7))-methyltransferase RsmG [Paenibacillus radicibacter]
MDALQQEFVAKLGEKGIELSEAQVDQFELYYKELVEWNEKINLTAITERSEVYWKHFYDSLSLSFYVEMNKVKSMADIGSGAGFPGIPLKIAFPHLKLTIVDSLNKRINFLKQLVEKLNVQDVNCVHGRAEDIGRLPEHRDQYDLSTARAVARFNSLAEFCMPFVKVGGKFVSMKGSEVEEEVKESGNCMKELRGKVLKVDRMELPVVGGVRHFVQVSKLAATPKKYPRKAGTPLKSPLL